ncbi:protein NRT1/ PTR FAMILY 5.5-like [Spinacia oleracea]|uniref:Protein NRT1/ PTR FAMILY 5.5-like n=1 Tax=Spinacia oleracea TaxID=3562 RepID=A0ABM3QSK3_SPIOL|nr:protein NRT1/ PTR FAMILY 5.5-like [Spinacia oleracea]
MDTIGGTAKKGRGFIRLLGLKWAHWFARIVMLWVMMLYLAEVWKLDLRHAATIINIWRGSTKVLPLVFVFVADAFLGHFSILLLSSLSNSLGLGLFWMSTPPVSAKLNGNCAEYKAECIENRQKQLFYTALVLNAVGIAGHVASFDFFAEKQIKSIAANLSTTFNLFNSSEEEINDVQVGVREQNPSPLASNFGLSSPSFPRHFLCLFCKCCGVFCFFFFSSIVFVAGILIVVFVKPWTIRFGVSAIFAVFSFLVFLSAAASYTYVGPRGSPFTTTFRVLFAACSKFFYRLPQDVCQLYENIALGESSLFSHTNSLRCLDKAAIILPHPDLNQQQQSRWKLCRVSEVEATKILIRLIPLWMTLIICGVVSSLGETYFMQQAESMNTELDPSLVFLFFNVFANLLFTKLFEMIADEVVGSSISRKRWVSLVGIAVAMMLSILCCIAAAIVEKKRLRIAKNQDLINEKIPMSIFWLMPQFALLGASDGILATSVTDLLSDQAPPPMSRYSIHFAFAASGIGYMVSPITVDIVGKISQNISGSGTSWFQATSNNSRLDNYFWVLAALSAANVVFYIVVASNYRFRDSKNNIFDKAPGVLLHGNHPLSSFFSL